MPLKAAAALKRIPIRAPAIGSLQTTLCSLLSLFTMSFFCLFLALTRRTVHDHKASYQSLVVIFSFAAAWPSVHQASGRSREQGG